MEQEPLHEEEFWEIPTIDEIDIALRWSDKEIKEIRHKLFLWSQEMKNDWISDEKNTFLKLLHYFNGNDHRKLIGIQERRTQVHSILNR